MYKKIMMIALLFCGLSAKAGLMIEPYIGYTQGTDRTEKNDVADFSSTNNGTVLGGRLGYKLILPWVALDYFTVNGSSKTDNDSNTTRDANRNVWSVDVGVDLPILLRAYVGYVFSNQYNTYNESYKGTGTKLGVGFSPIPFFSFNLGYITNNFDKVNENNAGFQSRSDVFSTLTSSEVLLTVSLPLNL